MIPGNYYSSIFLYTIIILTIFQCVYWSRLDYNLVSYGKNNLFGSILLVLIFSFFLGNRPISGYYFGDTAQYAFYFERVKAGFITYASGDGEWIWTLIMYICAFFCDVNLYFTIIALLYFGFTLWACRRLTPNNALVSFLFCLGAFSCFSYATNGIRNGLACSIILLMLSFITGNKREKIIAAVLAFIAFNIHRSTALPILMSVLSLLYIRSFKMAYTFWILSIFISLVAGGAISSFFAGLGFDDRMQTYIASSPQEAEMFSHTGFRLDFLIYSMMPILLGYYIIVKRGIRDRNYELLLNTYTLCNAFWVMVIRANYSNRFAYLSWFMYPLVLAYPLLKLDIWGEEQGRYLKNIMLAHVGFTWFMQTIYW